MTQSESERRIQRRFPYRIEVNLESEHNFYTGFTENISSGGLFIATRELVELGTTLRVQFTLPDVDGPINVDCEVRWQRLEQGGGTLSPGIGVHFLSLSTQEEGYVNAFLRKRETLFYDDE